MGPLCIFTTAANANTIAGTDRTTSIVHTTIASPTVGANQAIYVGEPSLYAPTVNITNTIVANYATGIQQAGGTVTTWNTLFDGNTADTSGTVTNNAPLAGDPDFVAPANDDYHLGPASPGVDAGVDAGVATDFDGDARPQGVRYDIGYDEVLQQCGLSTGVNYLFASPASQFPSVTWAASIAQQRSTSLAATRMPRASQGTG